MTEAQAQARTPTFIFSYKDLGKIFPLGDKVVLVEIARIEENPLLKVFLLVYEDGKVEPVVEGTRYHGITIKSEDEYLPLPKKLPDFRSFLNTETLDLKEAYEEVKQVLHKTVDFPRKEHYDLVTSWVSYTWVRGFFSKNVNLYFIGFPATGKSQALKFCKYFARYPIDYDPTSEKSYKWLISRTLGVLLIDEAEYLNKIQTARLRKYHEANVTETRTIGLPVQGLTNIDIRVDAPIVLSSTHPPADTAFMQRGYIIRMRKGNPEVKDFMLLDNILTLPESFAKTVLVNWKRIFEAYERVMTKLTFKNMDERIKDLIVPIASILEALGEKWDWVIDYAKYSFTQANFVTPETASFISLILLIRNVAEKTEEHYIIPLEDINKLLEELAERMGASPSKLNYLRQYLFSGCELKLRKDKFCYFCDKETVDAIINNLSFEEE